MSFTDPTAAYPSSTASRSDILLTSNRQTFSLSGNLSSSATDIPVNENLTSGDVPAQGQITIGDERIKYTGVDTTNDKFTGATRGFDGSTAASHSDGDTVDMNITAFNINRQAQEIIDMQGELGTSPSGSAADVDTRIGNLESSSYVSVNAETGLDNERTLNGSTAITLTDNGAGSNLDVAVSTGSITASLLDESTSPTWTGTHDFSGGTFIFPTATAPSPTTEGQAVWDSDDDSLKVGDGTSTQTVQSFVQADYVTITTDSGLDSERTLNAGTNLSLTDNGAGGSVTLDVDDAFVLNTGDTITGSLTYDTGANTNAVVDEDGIDRSSSSAETFNIQNSGTGSITVQQDGTALVPETRTLTGGNAIDAIGDLSANRTIAVSSDSIQTDELDLTISPTWTGTHTFENQADAASVQAGIFGGNRATTTNGDTAYLTLQLSDSAGTQTEFARMAWVADDITDGTEDGDLRFHTISAGSLGEVMRVDSNGVSLDGGTTTISASEFNSLDGVSGTLADVTGTPADNQVGVFTDSNTLEGDSNLTWDGSTLAVTNGDLNVASGLLQTDQANSRVIIGGPTSDPGNAAVDSNEMVVWFDDTNDVVKFRAEDAGGQQITGTFGSGGGNVSSDGTPSDNQLAVWTGSTTIEGDSGLTWDGSTFSVTDYNVTASTNWEVQSQNSATDAQWRYFAADGDGTDNVQQRIYAVGTPGSTTDSEFMAVEWSSTANAFKLRSTSTGTGSDRPIKLEGAATSDQIVARTDGNVSMANALKLGGTGAATGTLEIQTTAGEADGILAAPPDVSVDGGTNSSPELSLRAKHDSDTTASVTSANTDYTVQFVSQVSSGAQDGYVAHSVGGTDALRLQDNANVNVQNGTLSIHNSGAGSDPVLSANDAGDVLTLSNSLQLGSAANLILPQTTADYTVAWNDPAAARTYTLVDSGENSNFVLTSGTPADNQLAVWTADGVAEGDVNLTWDGSTFTIGGTNALSVGGASTLTGDVTFGTATQNYVLGNNGAELSLRAQSANTLSRVNLEAQTADGGDDVDLRTFAVGTAGATDTESLRVGYDAGGTEYLVQSEAAGTGSHRPIKIESGGNTDQFVAATGGNVGIGTGSPSKFFEVNGGDAVFTSSDSNATIVTVQNTDGTNNGTAQVNLDGASGGQSNLQFDESGSFRYIFGYEPGNSWFKVSTHDSDGSGTAANVIRIPDGQLSVDGNASFDDNAFDYVCNSCGWSAGAWEEHIACPKCGGEMEWHDDLAFAEQVVTDGPSLWDAAPEKLDRMENMGLIRTDDETGEVFVGFQKMMLFNFSAHSQAHRRFEAHDERIETIEDRVEQLEQVLRENRIDPDEVAS